MERIRARYGEPPPADLTTPLENAMSSYRTAETLQTYATRDAREASIANQLRCQSLVCRPTPPTVLSPAARIACVLVLLLRIMH